MCRIVRICAPIQAAEGPRGGSRRRWKFDVLKKRRLVQESIGESSREDRKRAVKALQLRERKCWQSARKKDRVRRYV